MKDSDDDTSSLLGIRTSFLVPEVTSTRFNYGSTRSRMDFDSDAGNSVVSQIRVNIQRLSGQVRELESQLPLVSIGSSGEQARDRFTALATDANHLAKETNRLMQQLVHLSNADRTMRIHREKLSDEFIQCLNRLQAAQKSGERAQKEGMKRARHSAEQDEDERRRNEAAAMDATRQSQLREQQRANVEEMKERTEALQELERDIADVQMIFTDLAKIVHEQGDMVESIEENVEAAAVHVETGNLQLQQAVYYQSKARQKKLMLCIFLAVLLAIIALTVYFYTK